MAVLLLSYGCTVCALICISHLICVLDFAATTSFYAHLFHHRICLIRDGCMHNPPFTPKWSAIVLLNECNVSVVEIWENSVCSMLNRLAIISQLCSVALISSLSSIIFAHISPANTIPTCSQLSSATSTSFGQSVYSLSIALPRPASYIRVPISFVHSTSINNIGLNYILISFLAYYLSNINLIIFL